VTFASGFDPETVRAGSRSSCRSRPAGRRHARANITIGRHDRTVRADDAGPRRLRALAAGRTVVVITHRMAGVREADRSYVLDHGRGGEEGDHSSPMSAGGIYRQLFTLQASAYRAG
jgi:hypothetical protein